MLNKSHGKSKHQNAQFKQIPMTEIQNVPIRRKKSINCLVCIGIWFLGSGYYLEFGYWDFTAVFRKVYRFYPNQLKPI